MSCPFRVIGRVENLDRLFLLHWTITPRIGNVKGDLVLFIGIEVAIATVNYFVHGFIFMVKLSQGTRRFDIVTIIVISCEVKEGTQKNDSERGRITKITDFSRKLIQNYINLVQNFTFLQKCPSKFDLKFQFFTKITSKILLKFQLFYKNYLHQNSDSGTASYYDPEY